MNSFLKTIRVAALLFIGTLFPEATFGQANADRLAALLKKFPAADANKDGKLSMEEVSAFREKNKSTRSVKKAQIAPTHANVKYGPHERHVFDLWLPKDAATSKSPLPLVIFFHGGGFVAGDKSGYDPSQFLNAGYAVASANYRFVDGESILCPTPMLDGARAVQSLRHKAKQWNLDPDRFALSGSSAGAVIALWIGYHNDLAQPDAEDPIMRESTRVAALIPINGPVNLDPIWIREVMGGPPQIHGSMSKMFAPNSEKYDSPEVRARILESSPWEFVTKNDPPTLLIYSTKLTEVPLPASTTTGALVHHPHFGKTLKAKLDDLRITADFMHSTDPRRTDFASAFLKEQFALLEKPK